jgi:CO/xanthine dehydrogenase Mo-binding subunit
MQLSAVWSQVKTPGEGEHHLKKFIETLAVETERVDERGKISGDTFTHSARYFKPYIMHGSIGPSCAVALWNGKTLHVWSHSQGVFPLRDALAELVSLPQDSVQVTGLPGSGCYGHNGADDVAADVALVAMAYPGKHVRLQWSREDEHGWEPYGSAMIMQASAALDSKGMITDWKYDFWSDTHSTRPGGKAENLLASRYINKSFNNSSKGYSGGASRNSPPYYSIPNLQVNAKFFKGPLRVSALRSLGAYANIFAIESFMDELADKAGKDPFEFRMMHLSDERARETLQRLHERISNEKTSEGSGIGIAFSRYKNSAAYCAVAALVKMDEKEQSIRVVKMWAVVDAGEVINTDGLKNQTEGGLIQAASWTMKEQVKFDDRRIISTDWGTYPILRFGEVPEVEVDILNRPEEEALGAGEAAQGPAAAAIANALFRASGKRVRDLPLIVHE